MIGPLVEYSEFWSVSKLCDAVLGDYSHSETCYKLVDTVVDFLVDMVWSAGEDDYLAVFLSCLTDYVISLCRYIAVEAVESFKCLIDSRRNLAFDVELFQCIFHYLYNVLSDVEVHIRMNEIFIVEARIISEQKLGIVCNDRAVEVVIAFSLVEVIAHAGIENEVCTFVEQILDVTVCKLCGVANSIRRDSMLTEVVHITRAFVTENGLETKLGKESMPERHLLIEAERERKTYLSDGARRLSGLFEGYYAVILVLIEVRHVVFLSLAAAFFTAVAGDEISAFAEVDDVELTVRSTASALCRPRCIGKCSKFVL